MRIISKFHDYYDIGMGLGHDSYVQYIRTPREIDFNDTLAPEDRITKDFFKKELKRPFYSHYETKFSFEYVVIGFCGVFYPLIILNKLGAQPIFCYSYEELSPLINDRYKHYKVFFDTAGALKNDELFLTNQSPIIVVELDDLKTKATWNKFLKPYNFARMVDPYQAFQKIEMFLGNMAAPEKPIPPRTDLDKVKSHGFDPKMGFRKGKNI